MRKLLLETLSSLGYGEPIRQGSMTEDEPYPESFITYFITDSSEIIHLDDEARGVEWACAVIFYTSDPEKLSSEPKRIYNVMKAAGFIPQGRGRDIPSDEPSHTGWAMDFLFIEHIATTD